MSVIRLSILPSISHWNLVLHSSPTVKESKLSQVFNTQALSNLPLLRLWNSSQTLYFLWNLLWNHRDREEVAESGLV